MSDIKKINTEYYGEKDEWLNPPAIANINFKIPKWGNLKNAYDNGVLELNKRLDNSFYMFGIKGESDFLFPTCMIYDSNAGYKLFRDSQDVAEISYFNLNNANIQADSLTWNESNNTQSGNNNFINGTGLKYPINYANYLPLISPLLDFKYTELCSLVYVTLTKQNENDYTEKSMTLDEYLTNIDSYSDYDLNSYFHNIRGGTSTNRPHARFFSNINIDFPENDLIKYPIFSYFGKFSTFSGGLPKAVNLGYSSGNKKTAVYFFANPKYWEIKEYTNITYGSIYKTIFKGSIDDLLKLISYVGICFTGNQTSANNAVLGENLTDENIYVPIITDGILSGEYKKGSAGAKLPQMTWENDIREKSGYRGIDSIDPTNYSDKISLSNPKIKSEGKFNTLYALSESEINALSNELWGADENKLKQILGGLMLMGENPLSCIVSLQLFPFDVTLKAQNTTVGRICLGATRMDTTGTKVKNLDSIIDLGSIKLRNYFNSFFDYEPYSTAFIYIPYCGTIQLSLNDCTGKTISIKLLVDYMNGVCTGVVFSDGIPIVYKNGVISQQISVTGTDTATMASNAISSSLGVLTNTTNLLAGGKDTSSIINNSANLLSSSFDYSAQRTLYQTQGANTSQINMLQPQKAYLVINLPKFEIADLYGKYHGFRCDFYDTVKNLKGYVETDKPILDNITATEEEKQMITELMCGGFYV